MHILAGGVPVAVVEYRGRVVALAALGEVKMCKRGWSCTSSRHHPGTIPGLSLVFRASRWTGPAQSR